MSSIEVSAERAHPAILVLQYVVIGRIRDIRLPPAAATARADGLWRHTCCEAFVSPASSGTYYEFNLAPSTQWAAYRFDGYRSGMTNAEIVDTPRIDTLLNEDRYELRAVFDVGGLPDLIHAPTWRLGLSAVIEEADGRISYWALTHPPDKPDFHHSDCFALELPTASLS